MCCRGVRGHCANGRCSRLESSHCRNAPVCQWRKLRLGFSFAWILIIDILASSWNKGITMNKQSEISEAFGCDQIVKAFKPVFPEARVMQNIIMPMDGFGHCPTAEFDVIVVCSAGVFPFEIKGHIGKSIEISKAENGAHYWKIHKSHGAVEIQDPLAQSGRKIKYLRESIKSCLVRGFVYFTNQEITLPPNANADVITTGDLPYLVRSLRQEAKRREKLLPETDVSRIADAFMSFPKSTQWKNTSSIAKRRANSNALTDRPMGGGIRQQKRRCATHRLHEKVRMNPALSNNSNCKPMFPR